MWQFMRLRGQEYGLTTMHDDRLDPEKPPAPPPVTSVISITRLIAAGHGRL
jgi:hypothetical protein